MYPSVHCFLRSRPFTTYLLQQQEVIEVCVLFEPEGRYHVGLVLVFTIVQSCSSSLGYQFDRDWWKYTCTLIRNDPLAGIPGVRHAHVEGSHHVDRKACLSLLVLLFSRSATQRRDDASLLIQPNRFLVPNTRHKIRSMVERKGR